MASLTKRCRHARPEWEQCGCQWYVRQRVGGKDTFTPAGNDLIAAKRALAAQESGAGETLSAALDAWLTFKTKEPGARPNSLSVYRSRVEHVRAVLGPNLVRSLRPADLTKFVHGRLEKGFAPATVQGMYAALTATLRHAQRRGVIATVPLPPDGPGIPTPQNRDHALTLAQVNSIIEDMPGVWGKVAELILLTGLRWGEAVAVAPGDVEDNALHVRRTRNRVGTTNAPKTSAGKRVVPLSARARELLGDLPLPVGGDYRAARKALVAAMGDLHRPGMGWHTIRAAHATLLDASGVSLRESAARMGHGHNFAMTLAYHVQSERGSADALDAARQHASRPSEDPGSDELAAARARRAQKGA